MSTFQTFAKGALAAAAGVTALTAAIAAPSMASAQPFGTGYYNQGGYDPCRREGNNRGVVGALLGGAIGASVGANAAARNNRQDGALLGGAVGAIAGATIGKNGAACTGNYQPYAPQSSYYGDHNRYGSGYGYDRGYGRDYYGDRGYRYGGDRYDSRYDDDGYDSGWAYGRRGERYRVADRAVGADGCSLAESPIYLPDGRTQKRFVRVCQDSNGRWQVVD